MKNIYFKKIFNFLILTLPFFLLFMYALDNPYYLVKNIIFFCSISFILFLNYKNKIIYSIILSILNIVFILLVNPFMQKELTYIYLATFLVVYFFSIITFIQNNAKILKQCTLKDFNKVDYITGAYNFKFLEELISKNYNPLKIDSMLTVIEIEDVDISGDIYEYLDIQDLLKKISLYIKKHISKKDFCFKIDGPYFVILHSDCNNWHNKIENFKSNLEKYDFKVKDNIININTNIASTLSSEFNDSNEYLNTSISCIKKARSNYSGIYLSFDKSLNKKIKKIDKILKS